MYDYLHFVSRIGNESMKAKLRTQLVISKTYFFLNIIPQFY